MPRPLGATWTEYGVNFAVFSSRATRIELVTFDAANGAVTSRHDLPARTGDVWHGLLAAGIPPPGTPYALHAHGPHLPGEGLLFDPSIGLIDPCAKDVTLAGPLRAKVTDGRFDWGADRPPATAWRDTVLYELHVKGFTRLHPQVPAELRGKYLGLAVPAVLEYLTSLGVTALELLPCQAFVSEPFLVARGLTNYWGYNPIAWFAPVPAYALAEPVAEFKTMVKALHGAGLEVILDVVFNHTAEGNEAGPVLSMKGLDNPAYYRLMPQGGRYQDFTGCGNTVGCDQSQVAALIVDCLRYWVSEMHVDGFRFDLATVLGRGADGFAADAAFFRAVRAEPALRGTKLIAEPWDLGPEGYRLGGFPPGWSEWNDRFRDTLRSFWRGDGARIGELAERFAGSSDIFRHDGRRPTASINFVTAHDGFTLHDAVSYTARRNEANLEHNADGTAANLSSNGGSEGESDDAPVLALRARRTRNLLATLLLSAGVPMLQAGDEFARTQGGNNNAYCQDNEVSWVDWRLRDRNRDLVEFVQLLTSLRRGHEALRRDAFLEGTAANGGPKDVSWLHARGGEMLAADWIDSELRTLGVLLGATEPAARSLLMLLNNDVAAHDFRMPAGTAWHRHFDTSGSAAPIDPARYALAAHSAVLLECVSHG